MSLLKKRFPTLEEQISRLSPKCRELTDEESRLVNGGGPSVWDTYNGTGCPYEYTTVPKDPPAETTSTANTPANKTSEILVSSVQQIGTMGQTGLATGPHLHLEIRNNNIKYNPRDFISFWKR